MLAVSDAANPATLPAVVLTPFSLILDDSDLNVRPTTHTQLFENYDNDHGANTIWLAIGDSDDSPIGRLCHFTWQTGEQGYGQRLVYASWDNEGKGRVLATTVLHKDLPAHSRVVMTLGSLDFNQRLLLETIMLDTPVPHVWGRARSVMRREWCKQVLEKGVAQKLFIGIELQAAIQTLETADVL